ncbi:D-2-hydroxyacid dehydrogenase family protein [Alicyclobacillus curvatus]|nr:D-2-hydroxyacid dehydrogenase family protein [Alicyclobacillus curvatus]
MKLRCTILDDYQNAALSMADWSTILSQVDVHVVREHIADEDELAAALHQSDIIVAMRERTPFRKSLLSRLPDLKLLVTTGKRNASIDVAAAVEQGVIVCGTDGSSNATSELTFALILGLAKNLLVENASLQNNGPWQTAISTDLSGSTLGILGLGRIGSQVARIGLAFGMDVVAWSQNLTGQQAASVGARLAGSKEDLLRQSDFVSIHLVLSDRTRSLIGEKELSLMKSSAYLINTSRSAIVDQSALIHALQNRRIAGAGLDVFDVEPLPQDDSFRSLPHVLATPHIGYVSKDTYRAWFPQVVENIQAYLLGSPIRQLTP